MRREGERGEMVDEMGGGGGGEDQVLKSISIYPLDPVQSCPGSAWYVCLPSWHDKGCSRCLG